MLRHNLQRTLHQLHHASFAPPVAHQFRMFSYWDLDTKLGVSATIGHYVQPVKEIWNTSTEMADGKDGHVRVKHFLRLREDIKQTVEVMTSAHVLMCVMRGAFRVTVGFL